ncbi:hypothetical protein FACS1894137_18780 [Spirochaetia bacterium]|nr:hypothetical protein FACS1894137_18780 [Spirochaetia bacterium]
MSITGALKKAVKGKTSSEVSNTPTIAIHDTGLLYKTEIEELKAEIARLRTENLILQEKVDLLTYKRFVRTSEKNDDGKQASLCAPSMGSNLAVKVRYTLGSRKC